MLHSLVSAQPPGHVVHICTQVEFDALLAPPNASESTSTLDDTTTIQLPEPKAGPQQEFISGSKKDFRIMGMTKTPYHLLRGILGQMQILFDLNKRTGMHHGDVARNTLRIVGEGDDAVPYVMDIPEYPWILHGEARRQNDYEPESGGNVRSVER